MARFNLQAGVAWPYDIPFRLLLSQSHVPTFAKWWSEENFWSFGQILRRTFPTYSFVVRAWFLRFNCDDSLVEPVYSKSWTVITID